MTANPTLLTENRSQSTPKIKLAIIAEPPYKRMISKLCKSLRD